MAMRMFLAIIRREGEGYVAECSESGLTCRGATPQEALARLREATRNAKGGAATGVCGSAQGAPNKAIGR